jgi:outer membrane protein
MTKIAQQMSETNLKRTEIDVKTQVLSSYVNILILNQGQKILQENIENMNKLQQNTNSMIINGVAEQTSADQLLVQIASIENAQQSNQRQIELAYNILRILLGLDANTELQLTDSIEQILNTDKIAELLISPYDTNQDLNAQLIDKNLELAQKQVCMDKATYLPTISGYYSHTFKLSTTSFDMQPADVVGLSASMPIFTSGKNYSKLKQSQLKLQVAELDKKSFNDQQLIVEKQLRFDLKNAFDKYQTQLKNIEISKRAFQSATNKYEYGKTSGQELTMANKILLEAQSNYISALSQLINAQIALEKLLNKI